MDKNWRRRGQGNRRRMLVRGMAHAFGSASENELEKSPLPDDGDEGVSHSDDFAENHECLVEASESKMNKVSVDSSIVRSDNRNKESKDVYRKDDGMERALKQQAQFIIQFQAMENVQREWEEIINETKMSLLENPEPCNQVNKDENSIRSAENSNLVGWIPEQEEDEKLSIKDISLTEEKKTEKCINCGMASKRAAGETIALCGIETVPKAFTLPPQERPDLTKKVHQGPIFEKPSDAPVGNVTVYPHERTLRWLSKEYYIQDNNQNKLLELEHQYATMSVNEAEQGIRGFTVPSQENPGSIYEKPSNIIPINSTTNPPKQRIRHSSLKEQLTPITKAKISTRGMLKERRPQQSSSSSLGSVLQSLQHARVSIRQELVKESSSAESTLAIPAPTNPPMKPTPTRKSLDLPIDSSSLFRLPSNSFSQVQLSGSNVYGSGLRLAATRPDLGFMASTVSADKVSSNQSSSQPGFNASVGKDYPDRHPFHPYMDSMSRVQVRKEHANYYPTRFVESESPNLKQDLSYHFLKESLIERS
ncbi:hypothetical protein KSP40_PGU007603 [Platanthera guangdongensis]|uniref:Uncharacterized protein n=1 Tax=Platanthera guangdongensis TaxID=2320717 RepID=A0ABR2LXG5_9ASPA